MRTQSRLRDFDRRMTCAQNVEMFDLGQCFSIVNEGHAELRCWDGAQCSMPRADIA